MITDGTSDGTMSPAVSNKRLFVNPKAAPPQGTDRSAFHQIDNTTYHEDLDCGVIIGCLGGD